jgi:transposase
MLLMRPYSEDLRRKIVAAVEGGMPKTEAARTFGVGLSSVKRYCRLAVHEEPLAPRKKGGGRPPKANATVARLLEEDVGSAPTPPPGSGWTSCAARAGWRCRRPPSGGSCASSGSLKKTEPPGCVRA